MGYDLTAKDRSLGDLGYFRATGDHMILLRTAMVAAGVKEDLVYRKFVGNDGLAITVLQSKHIAECLTTWLKRRAITVDLCEQNGAARSANEAYFQVFMALGNREARNRAKRFPKSKPLLFKIDSLARKQIREFAEFCRRSGGYWID
jgi:hypothetical protein